MGGGNPGDAGAGASDQRAARERYRTALFDREAGASGISMYFIGFNGISCHLSSQNDGKWMNMGV